MSADVFSVTIGNEAIGHGGSDRWLCIIFL